MRNLLLFTIVITLLSACKTHKIAIKPLSYVDNPVIFDQTKDFKNQGDQEKYWTEELFKQKYKKEKFQKYVGDIKITEDNHAIFGKRTIEFDNNPGIKSLLSLGVLYPAILFIGDLRVFDFEEITFVNHSDTAKRFRFYLVYKSFSNPSVYFLNPSVYFIELTNKNATSQTSIGDFIKGSKLTFLEEGWVEI